VSKVPDDSELPRFGLAFRIFVGGVALVCGVVMTLWAHGLGVIWKYWPALFCFCIVGAVVLPRNAAIACGYVIAGSILILCVWAMYLGFTGQESLANALRVCGIYGVPALAFVLFRRLTWTRAGDV
jgi:hypothetical protein